MTTFDLTKDELITTKVNDTTYKITRDNLIKAVLRVAAKQKKSDIKFEKIVCCCFLH